MAAPQPRHFQNILERDKLLSSEDLTATSLPSLTESLKVLLRDSGKGHGLQGTSVYTGLAGVAFVCLRIYEVLTRNQQLAQQCMQHDPVWEGGAAGFLDTALAILKVAQPAASSHHIRQPRITFLEGYPGVLALQAVCYHHKGMQQEALEAAKELELMTSLVISLPESECEVLYGRAGYLYALCFVRRSLGPGAISASTLETICHQILEDGAANVDADAAHEPGLNSWGLMYQWHYKQYLGGCHGLAGILYTLLLCGPDLESAIARQDTKKRMRAAANSLMDACLTSGNLPPALGSKQDTLVQWCHGAPGLTQLLAEMSLERWQPLFGDELQARALSTAARAAENIWDRGLLTKGLGLCHGISGNAYALAAAARASGRDSDRQSAILFGTFMAAHWQQLYPVPSQPVSLYEGLGGAICFWLEMLDDVTEARFPGFEL
ncbi:hypothetical protein WJX84_011071 [Apatococcus fuscideae]|uniref:Uncharacterized protein n=1 Tax=Apatococcus fuscideae TaxID=2026836 RepID=A0AAW1SL01_9CHLO